MGNRGRLHEGSGTREVVRDHALSGTGGATPGGRRPRAAELDSRLHAERARDRHGRRTMTAMPWAGLPDGVFVVGDAGQRPAVLSGDHLTEYDRDGYPARIADEAR